VAFAWRSFLTTLEWPLEDAIIRTVAPPLSCDGGREGGISYYCTWRVINRE